MTQYIFLSHDVDWRRQGPPLDHITARRDRFDESVVASAHEKNPYYNIPEIMEMEERAGVRSTFFFRTIYENGDYADYEDDIASLKKGNWEIGLHSDPASAGDIAKLKEEASRLERLTKAPITANRVHYLKYDSRLPAFLQTLGFVYDSSVKKFKDRISHEDMHYYKIDRLVEFPITMMDAYMFTYMKAEEKDIIPLFAEMLNAGRARDNDSNVMSVLWHDNVLKMKGGRMYSKVLDYLVSQDDVKIQRGIDLANGIINS